MPVNATEAERQAQADADLALKLRLEPRLERNLNELFTVMSVDMAAQYEATGTVLDAADYNGDFEGLLVRQNRRVSAAFSGRILNQLDEDDAALTAIAVVSGLTVAELMLKMRNEARTATTAMVRAAAVTSAREITSTNQREIDVLIGRARQVEGATQTSVAIGASREFRNRGRNRSPTIATTETQGIAEGTKQIERGVFVRNRNGLGASAAEVEPAEIFKEWVTRGDSKVRSAHIAADGQQVGPTEHFVVGGELLLMPKDPAGSPGNVINCRCAAIDVVL